MNTTIPPQMTPEVQSTAPAYTRNPEVLHQHASPIIGQRVPELTLQFTDGQTAQLSPSGGPTVILNFFRTDCTWCSVELPKWAIAYRRVERRTSALAVYGVAVGDDTAETVAQFVKDKEIDFPVVLDTDGSLRRAFGIERVPAVAVVDNTGSIARLFSGSAEQVAGILEHTAIAAVAGEPLPRYDFVGNGCTPE